MAVSSGLRAGVMPRRSGATVLLALAVAGVLVAIALAWRSTTAVEAVADTPPSATASMPPAPDFPIVLYQGPGGAGALTRPSDYAGSPLILNFWAVWCAPCRLEMPALERLSRDPALTGLVVLGVDTGPFDEARPQTPEAFLQEIGVTFAVGRLLDLREVAGLYGLGSVPTTVFVRSDGSVLAQWVGYIDEANLRSLAERLLAESRDGGQP
jgi:thiol-disulfide isomerase/thioredoxin